MAGFNISEGHRDSVGRDLVCRLKLARRLGSFVLRLGRPGPSRTRGCDRLGQSSFALAQRRLPNRGSESQIAGACKSFSSFWCGRFFSEESAAGSYRSPSFNRLGGSELATGAAKGFLGLPSCPCDMHTSSNTNRTFCITEVTVTCWTQTLSFDWVFGFKVWSCFASNFYQDQNVG